MRISNFEKEVIIQESQKQFGEGTSVFLFGSRTNDNKRGGDIDLLILPPNLADSKNLYFKKILFSVALDNHLEEQKIDVIVKYPNDKRGIIQTAINQGIKLC